MGWWIALALGIVVLVVFSCVMRLEFQDSRKYWLDFVQQCELAATASENNGDYNDDLFNSKFAIEETVYPIEEFPDLQERYYKAFRQYVWNTARTIDTRQLPCYSNTSGEAQDL